MKKILILSAILSSLSLASDLGAEIYISDEKPAVFKEEMKAEIISGRREAVQKVSTVFSYYKNNIYEIYTKPNYLTTIRLDKGEEINLIGGGDTERWLLEQAKGGEDNRNYVYIKPVESGLKTNLVINTNKKTYYLNIESTESMYNPLVEWIYPYDEKIAVFKSEQINEKLEAGSVENLNFEYRITENIYSWTPKEVFDDGIKTYLIMKKQMFSAEAPVFYVKDGKDLNLVNYRIKDNKIIIDRIFKEGVLKLGKKSIKIKNLKSE